MPPLAQIKIDQSGKLAGLPGFARQDLDTGTAVSLTAVGGPFKAYRWTLIDVPVDVDEDQLATTGITSPNQAITDVMPIDVAGTYLVQLEIDSGGGLGNSPDDIVRITFYAGPPLSPWAYELPQRIPAARETTEHNVPNDPYPAGNKTGWAYAVDRWFSIIRRMFRTGARAGVRVTTNDSNVTIVRAMYVQDVLFNAGSYQVILNPPFPDESYGVIATPHRSELYDTPVTWDVEVMGPDAFMVTFYDASNNPTPADFTVMAVLGAGGM